MDDDLKLLWKETDSRLASMEPVLRLNARLAQAGIRDRTRSRLGFVYVVLWYEVGFAVLAVVIIGAYLADNFAALRFAIPAAALQAAAVLNLALAARHWSGFTRSTSRARFWRSSVRWLKSASCVRGRIAGSCCRPRSSGRSRWSSCRTVSSDWTPIEPSGSRGLLAISPSGWR